MTSLTHEFAGWNRAELPVIAGPEPEGTVSLTALAAPEVHARLLPIFVSLAGGKRQGALTIIHYAVYAISTVLIAPLVFDRVALDAAPDQLGLVLDEQGGLTAVWVGQVTRADTARPPAYIGALAMRLLAPIAEESRRAARVSARAVANIVLDALSASCRRLENSSGIETQPGWVDKLIAAAGYPQYVPSRTILARPDDGPPVEFRVPRTCCVLNSKSSAHACPTCPRHPDDATRLRIIEEWLNGLDDNDFREVTGRARVPRMEGMPSCEVLTP